MREGDASPVIGFMFDPSVLFSTSGVLKMLFLPPVTVGESGAVDFFRGERGRMTGILEGDSAAVGIVTIDPGAAGGIGNGRRTGFAFILASELAVGASSVELGRVFFA